MKWLFFPIKLYIFCRSRCHGALRLGHWLPAGGYESVRLWWEGASWATPSNLRGLSRWTSCRLWTFSCKRTRRTQFHEACAQVFCSPSGRMLQQVIQGCTVPGTQLPHILSVAASQSWSTVARPWYSSPRGDSGLEGREGRVDPTLQQQWPELIWSSTPNRPHTTLFHLPDCNDVQ